MSLSQLQTWLIPLCLIAITTASTITDLRMRRIPNVLTLTALAAGLLCRTFFEGLPGLGDALGGFAIGFGSLFVLWASGGGGAGDAKLLGALGVWLGYRQTVSVLAVSAIFVVLLSVLAPLLIRFSPRLAVPNTAIPASPVTGAPSRRRTTVAFAIPLAMATWVIIGLNLAGLRVPLL